MADLCPIFHGIKQESRLITAQGNYCAMLAGKLEDHFHKSKVLKIEGQKLKGGIDLLACLPSILSKLAHPSNVKKGFIVTGILDKKSEAWPNLYATYGKHMQEEKP
jgi:hypothetical protein